MVRQSKSQPVSKNGQSPLRLLPLPSANGSDVFIWDEDDIPAHNYAALAKRLAEKGDLFRSPAYGSGLVHLLPDGKHSLVTKGAHLSPVIADRVPVQVIKNGKLKGGRIPAGHLGDMLLSETFLREFRPIDIISQVPLYLPDFTLTEPGYNDGGPGHRILQLGGKAVVSNSMATINKFLNVMAWETNADRTNAVAAALTVMLRNHWPGGKPIILATATKSHAGKDTVISFATGVAKSTSVSYQATNWAFERSIVGAIKTNPDSSVFVVENARLDRRDHYIASAYLERTATDAEPFLFSTGTGAPVRITNNFVLAISTNFGLVSEDLMNRSLPIHLHPLGDVAERKCPIGNPRYEFLPTHKDEIAAELRGMIQRWKAAGQHFDEDVRHPFSVWAKVVGGILKVNGFSDFLVNYGQRKTSDDPLRRGLAVLGAAKPSQWLPAADWAALAKEIGLTKTVIPESDRENEVSQARGIGVVLSAHEQETFVAETDAHRLTLRLEKRRGRFGGEPHVRYRFVETDRQALPED